jgi:murein DD-endopeptidase MepM/ murein hydrolase activator NlpD
MHTGMDLKLSLGDSVVAAWDGVVRMAKKNYYAYGNTVVIRHANGLETLYAHLSKINIQENQPVKAGDLIGYAGRTGRATTEHLHFETRFLYEHFNPNLIIDFTAFSLRSDTLYVRNRTFSNTSLADNLHTITTKDADSLTKDAPLATLSDETVPIQKTTQAPAKNTDTYIVKQGDTLYAISRKMNIRVDELCRLNHIKQESILRIGQKIKLK